MHVIIFADDLGKTAVRDAALKQAPRVDRQPGVVSDFLQCLERAYSAAPGASLDLKKIDNLVLNAEPADRISICCLTARYLLRHGQKQAAMTYLNRCYPFVYVTCIDQLLAAQMLRDAGIDPMALINPPPSK